MDKKYVKKEMQVKALENGTVIDHIPANKLFKVVEILQLEQISNEVTIGNNLASKRMGTKGIIKVANRFFESKEINRIALIAPNAKINIIRDYQVTEKSKEMLANIQNSAKSIRYKMAQRLRFQLRRMPELSFFLDDSLDYAQNIEDLLKK
jgi:aspartate carbamoyltransferase regulatory subunit